MKDFDYLAENKEPMRRCHYEKEGTTGCHANKKTKVAHQNS